MVKLRRILTQRMEPKNSVHFSNQTPNLPKIFVARHGIRIDFDKVAWKKYVEEMELSKQPFNKKDPVLSPDGLQQGCFLLINFRSRRIEQIFGKRKN